VINLPAIETPSRIKRKEDGEHVWNWNAGTSVEGDDADDCPELGPDWRNPKMEHPVPIQLSEADRRARISPNYVTCRSNAMTLVRAARQPLKKIPGTGGRPSSAQLG
jgi:hypothetical protein